MIRLAVRSLRHRTSGFFAAFVATFLGAAIIMACGGLMESGIRLAVPPQQLADADIVVTGDQRYEVPGMQYAVNLPERARIDEQLAETIATLPGVRETSVHTFDQPAPDGTVDAIAVTAEPGAGLEDVRERIDGQLPASAVTLTGDDRGLAEFPHAAVSTDVLVSLGGVFGAMAVLVSIYGVAAMLGLSIQQRRRELALLRAVGSTPAQLRQLVLGETLIVASVATALAVFPGRWLGEFIFDWTVDVGMVAEGVRFHLGWLPITVAMGSVLLAAVAGALVAGHAAAKTRPTEALAAAAGPERRPVSVGRILFGLLLLTGGAALSAVTMTALSGAYASATGMPAVIVVAIGLAVLSPLLTRPLAALLGWPLRMLTGQSGRLAVSNVRAAIDRTAAVVAPVILLTGVATGMLFMQQTEQDAVVQDYADGFAADLVVTGDQGVDGDTVAAVSALPGVSAASEYVESVGFVEQPYDTSLRNEGIGWTLLGITPEGIAAVYPALVIEGSFDELHGAAVALGDRQAAELDVEVGDSLTVRMGDNTAFDVEVVALFTADERDTLLLSADVLAAHTTAGLVTDILVLGDGDFGDEQLIASIEGLSVGGELVVTDTASLITAFADTQDTLSFATYTIVITIVAYAAITMINALVSSTAARRREFGLQRLIGSTRGQVLRMLTVEGLLVGTIGVLLGTVAAIGTIVPFAIGRTGDWIPTGSPFIYPAVVGGAAVLVAGAILASGWWGTRQRPIDAAVPRS